jgi:hypothetical protein
MFVQTAGERGSRKKVPEWVEESGNEGTRSEGARRRIS